MSGSDDRTGAPTGQEKSAKKPKSESAQDIHKREIRMAFGAIYSNDIEVAYDISDKTVLEWVLKGLQDFRPGTRKTCYLRSDVEEFLRRRLTFNGRERKRRPTNAKEKGPKKGKAKGA